MDWFVLVEAAAEAVSQVLVVVACGVILSRCGYLSNSQQKAISQVNLYFMTPCLLFTKIASTISWSQFTAFWPIPVFYVFFSLLSWAVAQVGSRLLGFTVDERKFVTASIIFSNTNSLPMALVQSLALSAAGDKLLRDEHDTKAAVAARGISYILFYAIFGNLVRWSYGFSLLVPEDEEEIDSMPGSPVEPSRPRLQYFVSSPVVYTVGRGVVMSKKTHNNSQYDDDSEAEEAAETQGLLTPRSTSPQLHLPQSSLPLHYQSRANSERELTVAQRAKALAMKVIRGVHQLLTPPLVTALLALLIGLVPQLHYLFMSPESNLYTFVIRPIEGCGSAAIPMILLCLGSQVVSFHEGSKKAKEKDSGNNNSNGTLTPSVVLDTSSQAQQPQHPMSTGLGYVQDPSDYIINNSNDAAGRHSFSSEDSRDEDENLRVPGAHRDSIGSDMSHASSSATLLRLTESPSLTPENPYHPNSRQGKLLQQQKYQQQHQIYPNSNHSRSSTAYGSTDDLSTTPPNGPATAEVLIPSSTSAARTSNRSNNKWLTPVAFSLIGRLLIVPVLAMPAILFHPETLSPVLTMDPIFPLTLVLLAAAPTAINMIQICQIKGFFEQEMAKLLFYAYCVLSIPVILTWTLIGLWAVGQ